MEHDVNGQGGTVRPFQARGQSCNQATTLAFTTHVHTHTYMHGHTRTHAHAHTPTHAKNGFASATNTCEGSIIALVKNVFSVKIARDNTGFKLSRVQCIAREAISSLKSLNKQT